jgi:hypothetical protein
VSAKELLIVRDDEELPAPAQSLVNGFVKSSQFAFVVGTCLEDETGTESLCSLILNGKEKFLISREAHVH